MIEPLLKYQELDMKQRAIKSQINATEEYKKTVQAMKYLKEAEESLIRMDKKVQDLNDHIGKMTNDFDANYNLLCEYESQITESQDLDELHYLEKKTAQLAHQLENQEKEINSIIGETEQLLQTYDEYAKKVPVSKQVYKENKAKFEEIVKERTPEMDKLKGDMSKLEKKINVKLLEAYKKLCANKIIPAVVPLAEHSRCGGCNMEIPPATAAKIESMGFTVCETCHRLVYKMK